MNPKQIRRLQDVPSSSVQKLHDGGLEVLMCETIWARGVVTSASESHNLTTSEVVFRYEGALYFVELLHQNFPARWVKSNPIVAKKVVLEEFTAYRLVAC